MQIIHSKDYADYRQQQLKRFHRKRNRVFVLDSQLEDIAAAVRKYCNPPWRGLCHGVRTGYEVTWLASHLDCSVVGTDIGPVEGDSLKGNWDFHDREPLWVNSFSFVYSNSLDHSDRPEIALDTWVEQLMPGGVLVIHWSRTHERAENRADCFGASLMEYEALVAARTSYLETIRTERRHRLLVGRKL